MNIRITLANNYDSTATRDMAMGISIALKARHASSPFPSSLEVSQWLHNTYINPRTRIDTHQDGSPIVITERASGTVLLTIHCSPTF